MAGVINAIGVAATDADPVTAGISVVKNHVPTILMIPLISMSIFLIIIGIIVFSTAKSKSPGILLLMLGFLMAGAAFVVIIKTETNKKK